MTDPTARLTAALADRYRIERELGAGGMATVYLAEDLKHRRRVAVKVLKPELAAVLGAERFVQEITTTAALQHPHILPLFDSGTADGFLYYVMPFIDGETLRAKLDRETQLGVEEAVKLASEVADALHYAHAQGVIHRDIKPENILLANGRPMVADFGIALAVSAAAGGRMTETGLSLGTPHYMSPEQATAEKEITARSDQYSLASVLYEMLTGNPPHVGASAQQIIMKIITEQPADVTALRRSVPPHVAAAVAKALEKLPADRFPSVQAFAQALGDRGFAATAVRAGSGAVAQGWQQRAARPLAVAAGLLLVIAAWGWSRPSGGTAAAIATPIWLAVDPPLATFGDYPTPVLSPDGRRLAFFAPNAEGVDQLWVRELASPAAQLVAGTARKEVDLSQQPFWSPDGRSVAYFAANTLFRVDFDGRPPVKLADAPNPRGGSWGRDGTILFVPATGGLHRVSADGGPVTPVTDPSAPEGAVDRWPFLLPDGEHYLFLRRAPGAPPAVLAASLDGDEARPVLEVPSRVEYADGHLYFVRDGALFAQPFDLASLALRGTATRVADGVGVSGGDYRNGAFSAAAGHVVTWSGTSSRLTRLVVLGASGRVVRQVGREAAYVGLALEPGGARLAVERANERTSVPGVWIVDLATGQSTVFATPGEGGGTPQWMPGGREIIYSTFTARTLVRQSLTSADTVSVPSPLAWIGGVSRDGRNGIIETTSPGTGLDIMLVPLDGDPTPRPYQATRSNETGASLSPDGAWLAYSSDASGRMEVYVQAFPVPSNRRLVSDGGGSHPQWSADGRQLYYLNTNDELVAASVTPNGDGLGVTRRTLFRVPRLYALTGVRKPYAPLPDGSFVFIVESDSVPVQAVRIGLNWAGR